MPSLPFVTAEEAASLIDHGDLVGFSGFTPAGAAKAVPEAIAARATRLHAEGKPFKIGVMTGASTGPSLDGALAMADAISFRTPYQSNTDLRKRINARQTKFFDMHLSAVAQTLRYGFFGPMKWAVIEACDVTPNGEVVPTSSVGNSLTFCNYAERIIVELNRRHPSALRGFHDLYEPLDPPHRREIPLYGVADRIGSDCIRVDPKKIAAVVETNLEDETSAFKPSNEITQQIGRHVARFLADELAAGRIPQPFLPVQSGVGNIANATLAALGTQAGLPPFQMFTEVIQDSVIDLIRAGRITFATGTSLTLSPPVLQSVYDDLKFFRSRLLLRPQEITNHPELVRRLGLLAINTAIEVDLFGHVNSSHVMGRDMMNGIGGSADFTRNAYLSIFTCPSTARNGAISAIVPMVSHVDHSEHSVQVLVTEHGVADLRGKDPEERAELIVENCADPDYRDELRGYLRLVSKGHIPQTLSNAFAMHEQYLRTGSMRGVEWDSEIVRQPAPVRAPEGRALAAELSATAQ
jgi:succinate CoA transferases